MTRGKEFVDFSTHDIFNGVIKNISPARMPAFVSLLLFALIGLAVGAQSKLEEFFDVDYGYLFNYPAGWAIRKLPEGESNADLRVMLQGPNGSTFTVVIEKLGKTTSKEDFESSPDRKKIVEDMISQTLEQTYKVISQNMKAKNMTVGERRDLSNENGIKFYVATLHAMPVGKSIIVAGIHAFPFGKNYSVNFLMSTFWDPAATQDRDTMMAIFNSFRLIGENESPSANPDAGADKPAAK